MSLSAQTFINRTLNLIGRLRPAQGAGPSESTAVLGMLNQLLDSWNTEHLSVYEIKNQQFALTSKQGAYTMGPDGTNSDFTAPRPVKIQSAGIIRAGLRFPLELINSKDWDLITEKPVQGFPGVSAIVPLKLYNDQGYPATTLHLWPTPDDSGLADGAGLQDTLWRTLLLKDTATGDDIADHLTVQESGVGTNVKAVLRKAIASDLTVEVVKNGTVIATITIPHATAVDHVITVDIHSVNFVEDDVLSWNITASDGSADIAGVASFTVEWKKQSAVTGSFASGWIDLSYWLQLSSVATLVSTMDLPPGYQRALMYNLAVEVATMFGLPVPQAVAAIAVQSKGDIQKLNASNNIPVEDIPAPAAQQ